MDSGKEWFKRSLKKTTGHANLSFEKLRTILVEVEGVINARSLTHVENDEDGVTYTLSPSHLMYGRRITSSSNPAILRFSVPTKHLRRDENTTYDC